MLDPSRVDDLTMYADERILFLFGNRVWWHVVFPHMPWLTICCCTALFRMAIVSVAFNTEHCTWLHSLAYSSTVGTHDPFECVSLMPRVASRCCHLTWTLYIPIFLLEMMFNILFSDSLNLDGCVDCPQKPNDAAHHPSNCTAENHGKRPSLHLQSRVEYV